MEEFKVGDRVKVRKKHRQGLDSSLSGEGIINKINWITPEPQITAMFSNGVNYVFGPEQLKLSVPKKPKTTYWVNVYENDYKHLYTSSLSKTKKEAIETVFGRGFLKTVKIKL